MEISKFLVENKLAACVQTSESPVISTYIWKGETKEDKEFVLKAKYAKAKNAEVEAAVKRLHPYECPQWYVFEPCCVSKEYAEWICAMA